MIGDAREIERFSCLGELLRLGAPERPRTAQVDIEPVERCGDADVEGLHQPAQIAAERMGGWDRAGHAGAEQRAIVDGDDVVRARPHEAHLIGLAVGKAGVKGRAPPPRAMRIDQVPDLGSDALARESFDHQAPLPSLIERNRHVLCDAAAAGSEPGTERRCALGRDVERLDEFRAFALKFDQRPLAGQGAGNDRAVGGEAMPMRVKRDDEYLLERLTHGARRSESPAPRRPRGSVTA